MGHVSARLRNTRADRVSGTRPARSESKNGNYIQADAMEYAALATGARRGTAKARHRMRGDMVNNMVDYNKRVTLVT